MAEYYFCVGAGAQPGLDHFVVLSPGVSILALWCSSTTLCLVYPLELCRGSAYTGQKREGSGNLCKGPLEGRCKQSC